MELYHGNIVFSETPETLAEYRNSYIAVEDGVVEGIYPSVPERFAGVRMTDFGEDAIIQAFSDLHVHAPQYPQRALAMDELLPQWLNRYTFPLEARYADMAFARSVYDAFLEDMIRCGTMHAAKAVQLSKIKAFYEPETSRAIPFAQAFYMATKGGGEAFGNVGSLAPGYAFDALVIGGLADPFRSLSPAETVERFCGMGETRHIRVRYLDGKKLVIAETDGQAGGAV